ncbi:MAG: hypothetical protein V1872_06680 [bacterium]
MKKSSAVRQVMAIIQASITNSVFGYKLTIKVKGSKNDIQRINFFEGSSFI